MTFSTTVFNYFFPLSFYQVDNYAMSFVRRNVVASFVISLTVILSGLHPDWILLSAPHLFIVGFCAAALDEQENE